MFAAPTKVHSRTNEMWCCSFFLLSLLPCFQVPSSTHSMQLSSFKSTPSSTMICSTIQYAHSIRGGDIQEGTRKKAVPFETFILKCEWLIDSTGCGGEDEFWKRPCYPDLISKWWGVSQCFWAVTFPMFLAQFLASSSSCPTQRTGIISVLLLYLLTLQGKSASRVLGYSS